MPTLDLLTWPDYGRPALLELWNPAQHAAGVTLDRVAAAPIYRVNKSLDKCMYDGILKTIKEDHNE